MSQGENHFIVTQFTGPGIGGFIGGQLIDHAGVSLRLLFKMTSIFLFGSAIIFYFLYKILCTKHEENLIKLKEKELLKLQKQEPLKLRIESKYQNQPEYKKTHLSVIDLMPKPNDISHQEKYMVYARNSQTQGISKF